MAADWAAEGLTWAHTGPEAANMLAIGSMVAMKFVLFILVYMHRVAGKPVIALANHATHKSGLLLLDRLSKSLIGWKTATTYSVHTVSLVRPARYYP